MKTQRLRLLALAAALGVALAACAGGNPIEMNQAAGATEIESGEPVEITGSYSVTNDFVFTYYVENAVALLDMHGFVIRDQEWELDRKSVV